MKGFVAVTKQTKYKKLAHKIQKILLKHSFSDVSRVFLLFQVFEIKDLKGNIIINQKEIKVNIYL